MSRLQRAAEHVLIHCGSLSDDDRVVILCDPGTRDLAETFAPVARRVTASVAVLEIPALANHGAEPGPTAAAAMRASTLIVSLCGYSLAHSKARIEAGLNGARFLSLPQYDVTVLESAALQVDFRAQAPLVRRMADALTAGRRLRVTTPAGTAIEMAVHGRTGNYCPGFVERPGDLGSPPDIEANVSPLEDSAEGIVIVDGSITHPAIGLLADPVEMRVSGGRVVEFRGKNVEQIRMLTEMFGPPDSRRRVCAECGIGLNPAAQLTGSMLTDEGALGCVHFGFGANHTVGGRNEVDFHLDFVCRSATVVVDGRTLLNEGVPQE